MKRILYTLVLICGLLIPSWGQNREHIGTIEIYRDTVDKAYYLRFQDVDTSVYKDVAFILDHITRMYLDAYLMPQVDVIISLLEENLKNGEDYYRTYLKQKARKEKEVLLLEKI